MNILVTGSNGQLGSELKALSAAFSGHRFFFTDVDELDITHKDEISDFLKRHTIDLLINCAAYTAVDQAEQEPDKAQLINVQAVQNLAQACSQNQCVLLHISTDYVFNGRAFRPYTEEDKRDPQSVYATTKARAEDMVQQYATAGIVVRTSWLYSSFGHNFIKTMMKYGREREQLRVVSDQIGTPTYARDLAQAILQISSKLKDFKGYEIYHYSNEGACSWYDFAQEIMQLTSTSCHIEPINSEQYPLPAARPFYSVLDKSKIKATFALEIPWWKDSLKDCINKIKA